MEAVGVRRALRVLRGRLQDRNYGALSAALRNLHSQEEQHWGAMRTWLREAQRENELLHQQLQELEEAAELEEAWQQRRQREAEAPEAVEARTVRGGPGALPPSERALRARRRGFCYCLQALSLLAVALPLALALAAAAVALYASRRDPELLYRALRLALPGAARTELGYALGRLLPVSCAGPLPS